MAIAAQPAARHGVEMSDTLSFSNFQIGGEQSKEEELKP
jgi:hypothetical protein